MLTILEAIKLSTEYLEKKGIESARLNSELMLADMLNCKRLDLYLTFERPLKDEEVDKLRQWISRRGKNEPLQYILGKADFFGLQFEVDSSVLIPRPETEILVDHIIAQNKSHSKLDVLDIGTGSGIIPIILAMNLPESNLTAIDVSSEAINLAKKNAVKHSVLDRINFLNQDIFSTEFSAQSFDLIVSNPPYVALSEYLTLQKEIVDFEPKEAVTDEGDGLKFYSFIAEKAKLWLKDGGKLYFELGKGQFSFVEEKLKVQGYSNISVTKDLANIERVIQGSK
ncbi:MAG: peptide chain release factor N(5)-glutamine methyltransferase [Melioribacteraceae bacterium]